MIAAGSTFELAFGSNKWLPSKFNFTQILPLVDPANDPSLRTRGNFTDKVRQRAQRAWGAKGGVG